MSTAKLSTKFQISVRKGMREARGPGPGQKPASIQTGSGLRLVPEPLVADLLGLARRAN